MGPTGTTPLYWAAQLNNTKLSRLLIEKGADVCNETLIEYKDKTGKTFPEELRFIIELNQALRQGQEFPAEHPVTIVIDKLMAYLGTHKHSPLLGHGPDTMILNMVIHNIIEEVIPSAAWYADILTQMTLDILEDDRSDMAPRIEKEEKLVKIQQDPYKGFFFSEWMKGVRDEAGYALRAELLPGSPLTKNIYEESFSHVYEAHFKVDTLDREEIDDCHMRAQQFFAENKDAVRKNSSKATITRFLDKTIRNR